MDRETKRSLIIQAATRIYQERVEWALDAFEAGVDSESLRILASLALAKPPHPREVDDYFRRSFQELGWKMPKPEEYRRQHARGVVEKILTSKRSPIVAGIELDKIARELAYSKGPGFRGDLATYVT
jgi:hypothetical protein